MFKLLLIILLSVDIFASQRVVALSPAINEIIFALGKGNLIVGNTTYCSYPKESKKITKVGGYFNPSLEMIISLSPTIVIMQQNNYKLRDKLIKLGIKSKVIKIDKLKSIKKSILDIGTILKSKEIAGNIVDTISIELKNSKNIVKNQKILIVIGHNTTLDSRVFVAGRNLYFNEIIENSGNINALKSSRKGQPILNMENIIATDADIVILLAPSLKEYGLSKKDILKPWKNLPINASKNGNIYIIDKEYAGIPSDRLILFLQDFTKILYDVKHKQLLK